MYDPTIVSKLVACLRFLGLEPIMTTFDRRKTAQKLVYLMATFGVTFPFDFTWYLHGPYSPLLTQVLYDVTRAGKFLESNYSMSKQDADRLESLRSFLGGDLSASDALELIVSIHFILSLSRPEDIPDTEALRILRERKPFFSEKEVDRCYRKVCSIMSQK